MEQLYLCYIADKGLFASHMVSFSDVNDPSFGPMCFGIYENQEVNNNENVEVVVDNILEMKIGFWLNAENEVINSSMTFKLT